MREFYQKMCDFEGKIGVNLMKITERKNKK